MKVPGVLAVMVVAVLGVIAGTLAPTTKAKVLQEPVLPTIDEIAAVYDLAAQYESAGEEALISELAAYRQAYSEKALPILQRELDLGHCEVLDPSVPRHIPHFMELEAIEHDVNGGQRRVRLNPAEYPQLLEYRIRLEWLNRECIRRGYKITHDSGQPFSDH